MEIVIKGRKMEHSWIKSTLGHGFLMCEDCFITVLEASAIGQFKCKKGKTDEKNEA